MKINTAIWSCGGISACWRCGYALGGGAAAHATKSVTIDAPATKVWKAVQGLQRLQYSWHPAVATDEIVDGTNNTVGAVPLADAEGRRHDQGKTAGVQCGGPLVQIRHPRGGAPGEQLQVDTRSSKPAGKGKSTVTWTGRFKRKNIGDNPADKENDKTAVDTMGGVYQGGLDNLKTMLEGYATP